MKFEIAIFAKANCYEIVKVSIQEYLITNVEMIKIICPKQDTSSFINLLGKRVTIINDCEIDDCEMYEILKKYEKEINDKKRSVGWYYQQYIKLKYSINCNIINYIIDGDTFVSSETISNFIKDKKISISYENVNIYTNSLNNYWGMNILTKKSFITNSIVVEPGILNINKNEFNKYYINWIKQVLNNANEDISEYQLIGNKLLSNYNYKIKKVRFFRRADLFLDKKTVFEVVNKLKNKYSIVAFEKNHKKSYVKKLVAKIYAYFGISW
jgi:hypothetical protein